MKLSLTKWHIIKRSYPVNRGSNKSAYVLLNLLNELWKSDILRGLPSV